jgi:hypothetical protein
MGSARVDPKAGEPDKLDSLDHRSDVRPKVRTAFCCPPLRTGIEHVTCTTRLEHGPGQRLARETTINRTDVEICDNSKVAPVPCNPWVHPVCCPRFCSQDLGRRREVAQGAQDPEHGDD